MIDLHYWTTPNGHKITIFLEETGLPYKIFPINIGKGEQFAKDFLKIAPNNRIPAMVDHEPPGGGAPLAMFESGAMLLYLADKTKKFIPQDLRGRSAAIEWLFWQMANLGPNSGQNNHFNNYAVDKIPYAMDRYRNEVNRLYGVLDRRLADNEYMAGEYSIADMATYPWIVPYERQGQNSTTSRTSSAGSRPSRRVRRSSVPTPRRRRSTRTRAASAPRKSAPSCSVRPRRRCRRRCGRAGAQARAALRRRLSSPAARAARSRSAETGRSRPARSSRTGCRARSRHRSAAS